MIKKKISEKSETILRKKYQGFLSNTNSTRISIISENYQIDGWPSIIINQDRIKSFPINTVKLYLQYRHI